jgi:uncharacterized protein
MFKPPLPRYADLRKLVASGAGVKGAIRLAELPRLAAVATSVDGDADVQLSGSIDEEGFRLVGGTITTTLELQCQRCLESMQLPVLSQVELALVWREEEIAALPHRLDGLVVGTEPSDLYALVEEELLLMLPLAPRHEVACQVRGFAPPVDAQPEPDAPGPFAVLDEMKRVLR